MGNNNSVEQDNRDKVNLQLSPDEYNQYVRYLNSQKHKNRNQAHTQLNQGQHVQQQRTNQQQSKQYRQSNQTRQQNTKINNFTQDFNNSHQLNREGTAHKREMNNKMNNYHMFSGSSFQKQFSPLIGESTLNRNDNDRQNAELYENEINSRAYNTKSVSDSYLPRMEMNMSSQRESQNDFNQKVEQLNANRNYNKEPTQQYQQTIPIIPFVNLYLLCHCLSIVHHRSIRF